MLNILQIPSELVLWNNVYIKFFFVAHDFVV